MATKLRGARFSLLEQGLHGGREAGVVAVVRADNLNFIDADLVRPRLVARRMIGAGLVGCDGNVVLRGLSDTGERKTTAQNWNHG